MPSFTGACLALFAAIVAMTHVAAIRDSYDEFGKLSVSEDQEQEQEYEKVKGEKVIHMTWQKDTPITYREGKTPYHSRRLQLKDFGIDVTPSMRVAAIADMSNAWKRNVQLGWKLTKLGGKPVKTLEVVNTTLSASTKLQAGRVPLFFETPEGFEAPIDSEAGMELEEFLIPAKPDLDLAQFGLETDSNCRVQAVTLGTDATRTGIAPPDDDKTWTLKWVGDTQVSSRQEIDRAVEEVTRLTRADVPETSSTFVVSHTLMLSLTFLTVPEAMVDPEFRSQEKRLGFTTIMCHFFGTSEIQQSGAAGDPDFKFKVTVAGMVFPPSSASGRNGFLTIGSDRKVQDEVLVGRPAAETVVRVLKGWTLEAIDEKWAYTAWDQVATLFHIISKIQTRGDGESRMVSLKFCTNLGGCKGKPHCIQDLRKWQRMITMDESHEVQVEVKDEAQNMYIGKVTSVQASTASEGTVDVEVGEKGTTGHKCFVFDMPDDADRILRVVGVKELKQH